MAKVGDVSARERIVGLRPAPTEPLWTVEDAATYLRLKDETVRTMAREGKLPAVKVGRGWRFRAADIKAIARVAVDGEL